MPDQACPPDHPVTIPAHRMEYYRECSAALAKVRHILLGFGPPDEVASENFDDVMASPFAVVTLAEARMQQLNKE